MRRPGASRTITVVEPKLTVAVSGPDRRCTDTNAIYTIAVANPGTAPARKVRVVATVPPGARLPAMPKGARYDSASRRLQWSIDAVEPGPNPQKLSFEVKVGDVGKYEVNAEASAEGGLKKKNSLVTEVFGMADLDLAVSERQRVVNVKGKTIFFIVLHNYGTKEATNIRLSADVSKNLEVTGSFDVPADFEFAGKDGHTRAAGRGERRDQESRPRQGPEDGARGRGHERQARGRHLPESRSPTTG